MGCKKTIEYCGNVEGHFDWINDLHITEDGTIYSFSSDGTFRKWRDNKEISKTYAHEGKIWRAVFDEENKEFYTIAWDGWVKKWDMKTNELIAGKQFHDTFSMAISVDNEHVYSADWNQKLVKSDKNSLKIVKTQEIPEIPMASIIYGDELLIGGKEGSLLVIDKASLRVKQEIKLHNSMIWRIEPFIQDLLVSFSYDGFVKVLKKSENGSWEVVLSLGNRDEPLMGGGVIEGLIVGGTLLGELIFWDGITGDQLLKWKAHEKAALVVKKRNDLIVSGGRDRRIKGFSLKFSLSSGNNLGGDLRILEKFTIQGSDLTPVSSVSDEQGLLTGYWEKKAIYCEKVANNWKQEAIIEGKLSAINDVELTKDKAFIVSANRKLVVFNRVEKKVEKEIKLPDNPLLIGAVNKSLVIAYRKGMVEKRLVDNPEINELLGKIGFKPLKMNCLEKGVEILGRNASEKRFFEI